LPGFASKRHPVRTLLREGFLPHQQELSRLARRNRNHRKRKIPVPQFAGPAFSR
jgi:hypothetical protein